MARTKTKYRPGLMVQTNERFAKIVGNRRPIPGVLMRPMPHGNGAWLVWLDGFIKPHHVHEKLMEECNMELETTTEAWDELPKAKRVHFTWTEAGSGGRPEWHAKVDDESLPVRIQELDKKTYSVYRNGKYLGSEDSLDNAKKRAVLNAVSQKNRVMRLWEREHPNELPPGLQLTDSERTEYWRVHAASKPKPAALAGGRTPSRQPAETQAPTRGEPREAKPRNSVPGGNTAKIAAMLTRDGGCTREDVLKETGWSAVSMQQQAKQAGLTLKVDKGRKPFRYSAEGK